MLGLGHILDELVRNLAPGQVFVVVMTILVIMGTWLCIKVWFAGKARCLEEVANDMNGVANGTQNPSGVLMKLISNGIDRHERGCQKHIVRHIDDKHEIQCKSIKAVEKILNVVKGALEKAVSKADQERGELFRRVNRLETKNG